TQVLCSGRSAVRARVGRLPSPAAVGPGALGRRLGVLAVDSPSQPPSLPRQVERAPDRPRAVRSRRLRMRKVIVSLGAGPQSRLLRIASRSFRRYAARHGYELALHTELADAARPAPWSKVPLLRSLAGTHQLLLWLDADVVIVNGSLDIATELEDERFLY